MNKNNHVWLVLNFLLLILVIDIYISVNVKNNIIEQFTLTNIKGKQMVCLVNNLCALVDPEVNDTNISQKKMYHIITLIILHNQNIIQDHFLKINNNIELEDTTARFEKKKQEFINFWNNIDELKIRTKNINEADNVVVEEEDMDSEYNFDIINKAQHKMKITLASENKDKSKRMIAELFDNLLKSNDSCIKIKSIIKYLIIFYVENIENKETINEDDDIKYTNKCFFTIITELLAIIDNDQCSNFDLFKC